MEMELRVQRKWKKNDYTIGNFYINGELYCNTLEDKDRGITQEMTVEKIQSLKVKNQTAIPTGTYTVTINVISPRFSKKTFYQEVCKGRVPRLLNVKGFDGILIHVGDGSNGKNLTAGCILVGKNTIVGGLTGGKEIFKDLYKKLTEANNKGERITITIE